MRNCGQNYHERIQIKIPFWSFWDFQTLLWVSELWSSNSLHLNWGLIWAFQTFCTSLSINGHCPQDFRHFPFCPVFLREQKYVQHCWLFLIMGSCGFSALCGTSSSGNRGKRLEWIPSRKLKFKLSLQTGINGRGQGEIYIPQRGAASTLPTGMEK